MPYANLQPVFDEAELQLCIDNIAECQSRLPFLINLTPEEKKLYLRLGKKTLSFISRALLHCKNNSNLQVDFAPYAEWKNDWEVCQRLELLEIQIQQLHEGILDTIIALRQESMRAGLTFYRNAKEATKYNVPGSNSIVEDLSTMMPGRKAKKVVVETKKEKE